MAIKSFLSEGGFSVGSVGSAPIEVIDSSGNITAVGLTVSGNLVVNGSTTTINSTTTTLDDPIFTLGGDTVPTSDDNKDRGIEFRWHNGSLAKVGFFGYDDSTGKFVFIPDATNTSEVFSGTKGTIDANLEWADVLSKPSPVVTVTLTGDVTGTANATLTSLGNGTITINTTVAGDAIALGTDTTGNYVASITNGSYITGGNGGSEGAALTLAVDATSANTASKVVARDASGNFSAGTITAAGGVIASGQTANSWLFEARGTAVTGGFSQYGNNIKSVQYWNASNTISVGSSYSANVANDGDLIVSGKIGVGTLSPGGKLEVNFTAATAATAVILRTSDSGANGAIRWQNSGGTNQAGIGSNFNVSDVGALEFLNGTTTNVIFRSSGNVGIGTTAPQTRLHAYTSTADGTGAGRTTALNVLTLESENTADLEYNGFGQGLVFRGSTYNNSTQRTLGRIVHKINDESVNTTRGTSIHFETSDNATNTNAPTEKMVINYAGNVGIGKSNPQQKLHLAGTNARIAISNDSDNNWAEIGNDGASGQNTLEFFTGSSSVPAMSITHGNSVGVGTATPTQRLHLNGGVLRISGGGANSNGEINLDSGTEYDGWQVRKESSTQWGVKSVTSGNDLAIFVDNTTARGVYIKTGGNVGINNTNPAHKLDVGGAIRTTDWLYIENSNFGIYSNASSLYFSTSTNNWDISSAAGQTWSGLRLYSGGRGNTWRGHFYGDSTGQGFLDSGGNWQLIVDSSSRLRVYAGVYNIEGTTVRVLNPGGAALNDPAAPVTGAFKIKLPVAAYNSNTMMTLVVDIYNYDTGKSLRFRVGGYNYQDGSWYNTFAEQTSDLGVAAYNVRFGNDGTSNCIWIGETNSTWQYPKVFVSQFLGAHAATTSAWASGWTISRVTSFDTVAATRSASVSLNNNNVGAYSVNYLTGTANQVLVNGGSGVNVTGGVTLTLPQNIHTGATPTFSSLTLSGDVLTLSGSGVSAYTTNAARIYNQSGVGVTINANTFEVRTGTSSASLALSVSNTQNTTVAGNLTVSGTGVNTFGTTGKTAIQQSAGSGALVAGGWIYGIDEGLNFAPNGAGLNKKLVMAHWDGSAYRSVLEYSNVSSGTTTLKLSDYGGLTTVGGNLTVSGTTNSTSAITGSIVTSGGIGVAKQLTTAGGILSIGSNSGQLRIEGNSVLSGTSGPGLEAGYSSGGSAAFVQGYDRTLSAFIPFLIYGSSITLGASTSQSTTVAGNLTVSGTGGVQLNSLANLTWGGAYGAGIPTIAIPTATSIGFYPTGSTSGKTFELFGTGAATLTGNLTVNGTGKQTLGQSVNATVYAGNSATTDQAIILSNTRRANYGDVMIAKNLEGVASADSYATPGTSAATGYAAVEMRYGGVVRVYGNSGATTAAAVVAPNVLAEFTPTAIGLNLNTTVTGNLTVSGNLIINGTTTTVNSTTTTLDDPIITLGGDTAPTVDDNKDRGVEFRWHNGTAAKVGFFGYDDSTGYFTFIPDATNTSEVFSGTQGDIQAANFRGNLIGNVTGNVSGSAGSVATLTAGTYLTGGSFNGSTNVTFAVDATSANTASKVVARDGSGNFSAGGITASSFTDGYNTFTLAQINRSAGAVELQYNKSAAGENVHIFGNTANRWAWQADTGRLVLGSSGDTNLYRSAADTLKTDDNFVSAATITAASLIVGNAGTAIGSAPVVINGTVGDNDSHLTIKKPSQSVLSFLAWDGGNYIASNTHYENGTWIHSAPSGNTNSQLLNFVPGTGVKWWTSSNSTSSWNVSSDLVLWNDSGVWQRSLANTLTLATSGIGLSGSATYNNSGAATFTVTSNATSANTASTIVARDASGNFSAGTITSSNLSTTTLTQGGTAGHITKEYTFNLSAQSNTQFFPIRLTGTPMGAGGIHTVEVVMDSFGGGDAYNHHSVIGKVRGSGWTDLPAFYDVFHNCYQDNERSYLGFYRGTQNCTDVILYVRGGKTYYVKTPSTASVSTTALTVGDSVFAIKDSAGADVSGTSANVSFMLNLITTTQGRHISSNLGISGSLSGSLANTLTLNTNSGAGLSGSTTYNNSGAATFTVTSNATSANTASTIVFRDGSGNFSAGTVTAALSGNATTATTWQTARNLSIGGTSKSVNGSADVTWTTSEIGINNGTLTLAVSGTGLSGSASFTANQSGNSTFTVTSNATSANAVSTIVARDSNGDFNSRNITLTGSLNAVTKSFVIPHPAKEGKKLRYGSLEGPENGVYVRGKLKGTNVIELPDYWTKLVDPESITVQLTPIGSHQKLYVEKIEDNKVYIVNENLLAKAINCFFYVLAERCDVEKLEVEIDA